MLIGSPNTFEALDRTVAEAAESVENKLAVEMWKIRRLEIREQRATTFTSEQNKNICHCAAEARGGKMTAEIAVANKYAVALAADSKVTIGGGRNAKTYDSVNKVFTLSKTHPVGVMIFGNAEFMNYPWETIIKLYRREHGSRSKNHILGWSDDFQKYISNFGEIEVKHRSENIRSITSHWLLTLEEDAIEHATNHSIPVPSKEYEEALLKTIENHTKSIATSDTWLSKAKTKTLLKNYGTDIVLAIKDVFSANEESALFKASVDFALLALIRNIDSPQSSGFVVAGFGEKEIFPKVVEHNTDGFIGENLKIRREPLKDISRDMGGYVGAFAQKDMAQIFMNGFDANLITRMTGSLAEVLKDSCLTVLDAHGKKMSQTEKVRAEIKKATDDRVRNLVKEFVKDSRERFSGPIIEMVSVLPKEELAHLAESLVALTSLRRRVSREAETVGGAVDVALISKGDGFVWIKRKHYFKPEINPQFIRNYMDDIRKEE